MYAETLHLRHPLRPLCGFSNAQRHTSQPLRAPRPPMKSAVPVFAVVLMLVLLVASFGTDVTQMAAGGSIDLRNRITGARLMAAHRDAFHYKWKLPEPSELCDPFNNPALPITRTTVTPTLLMLNLPLAPLPYRYIQYIWLITQWLMLLGTAAMWMLVIPKGGWRWLWAATVTGFTFTVAWRHHTDRGQAYVVMLFILACWILVTRHPKHDNGFLPGLIAGLLVALRPPFLLLLSPFVLVRRRGQLLGALCGLVLSAGLPLLWSPSCWSDYHSAMQTWSDLYRAGTFNPKPPPQAYPPQVEGLSIDTLAHFSRDIPFADSSLFALFKSLGADIVPALPVLLTLVLLVALWFRASRGQPDDIVLAGIAAWSFLGDLFLPAPRNSYNDVQILNLVAFGLVLARGRQPWLVWLLLAAWPLNWAVMVALPREKWIINLPSVVLMTGAVLMLVMPVLQKSKPESAVLQ